MSKKGKAKQATRKSAKREDDDPARTRDRNAHREDYEEILPSDTNDSADISPRVAFLAYN